MLFAVAQSILSAALLLMIVSSAYAGGTLTTENYTVTIKEHCEEGVVVCDEVEYVGTNRKTKRSIRLRGRDLFHMCPDDHGDGLGKTPCHHMGHEFRSGNIFYQVWDWGELEVWRGAPLPPKGKQLLRELGTWKRD